MSVNFALILFCLLLVSGAIWVAEDGKGARLLKLTAR